MMERDVNAEGCGCLIGIVFVLFLFTITLLLSSCSPKIVERIVTRDTTIIQIHERQIHDTATFELPVEVVRNVTTDTSSHIENTYAWSEAVVSDGVLTHTLQTKPQQIAVPFTVSVSDTSTTTTSSIEHEHITTVEVEKPLSRWQTFRLRAFWYLVAGLAVSLILFYLILKK